MCENEPLISVVIPVYNAENFITEALNSVCNQTYRNLEIIVIDDGSTDSSKLQIQRVAEFDERVKLISRENKGLINSLNEGITKSNGSYIARMDADDICLPNRFIQQISHFKKHPNISVLFTSIEYINEKNEVGRRKVSSKNRLIEPVEFLFGCPVCHPSAMFNMNLLSKSDITYDSNFNKAEDFELWTRLSSKYSIGILNEVLFQYRIHSGSITSQNSDTQRKVAVEAIHKNFNLTNDSEKLSLSLYVIYNNHQGNESKALTIMSLIKLFLKLKSINRDFSRYKFSSKSFYLIRDKLNKSEKKGLREQSSTTSGL